MHRCYTPGADFEAPSLRVEGEEARHALRVMRLRPGDELEVFDGAGRAAVARLVQAEGSSAMQLQVLRPLPPLPPVAQITLAIAIPKGANMDLIAQKAVELGACRIIPLVTERTIARPGAGDAAAKAAKWQRTVLEACKQSGVNLLPAVELPQAFSLFLQRADLPSLKLQCAITPEARPMRETLEAARAVGHRAVVLLIGPEGDFSPAEYAASAAAGYAPISLGPIILRVETAAFMALSSARYALD
ncbi:MAG: 16S rRNA (uracil(1498)-N(3))-methyltransferase [Akkermansia muciniphila]|nr:16S rRNA (uracil(1498)-N(3))-methyltransferase [Akkermansia muciniphila]